MKIIYIWLVLMTSLMLTSCEISDSSLPQDLLEKFESDRGQGGQKKDDNVTGDNNDNDIETDQTEFPYGPYHIGNYDYNCKLQKNGSGIVDNDQLNYNFLLRGSSTCIRFMYSKSIKNESEIRSELLKKAMKKTSVANLSTTAFEVPSQMWLYALGSNVNGDYGDHISVEFIVYKSDSDESGKISVAEYNPKCKLEIYNGNTSMHRARLDDASTCCRYLYTTEKYSSNSEILMKLIGRPVVYPKNGNEVELQMDETPSNTSKRMYLYIMGCNGEGEYGSPSTLDFKIY